MTKIRVHEYAKQVNKSSKEVIEALSKIKCKCNESYGYARKRCCDEVESDI